MPWDILVWLVAFAAQCGLLGISMYQLVQLTDLEADHINPHEASVNYNKLVLPEFAVEACLTCFLLLSGKWFLGALHVAVLLHTINQYRAGKHLADVTEIFREVAGRRKATLLKLVMHLAAFLLTTYRFIEAIVVGLLTPAGRKAARSVLKEAAAALHRR